MIRINLVLGFFIFLALGLLYNSYYVKQPVEIIAAKLTVVKVTDSVIVLSYDRTIRSIKAYNATVSWTVNCNSVSYDLGLRAQARTPGVYTASNEFIAPITILNQDCLFQTTFSWQPKLSLGNHLHTLTVIPFKVTKSSATNKEVFK